MHDRAALGAADVDDAELARMVSTLRGTGAPVTVLTSRAEVVPYDLEAITTAGRHWVRGTARDLDGDFAFSFFVKQVQSWSRSPLFQLVPPEFRELAAAGMPWRAEGLVYRSGLGAALPAGLRTAPVYAVHDLDAESVALWLGEVDTCDSPWDLARYARAARLLGRLAASPALAPFADVGQEPSTVTMYGEGRLRVQVLPVLRDDGVWGHPLVAGAFDAGLRARLLAAADRADALVAELAAVPHLTGHGDACPNNLLVVPASEDFVLIDFGLWGSRPVGFDLGQLLVGDVQVGRRGTEDLGERDEACLTAYLTGLHDEGYEVPESVLRRAHALQLLVFTGLSSLPFELLGERPTPELVEVALSRAAIARHCLDLLDATEG